MGLLLIKTNIKACAQKKKGREQTQQGEYISDKKKREEDEIQDYLLHVQSKNKEKHPFDFPFYSF